MKDSYKVETKLIPVRITPEKWARFCLASQKYGRHPSHVLKELIEHVDACMVAIASGEIANLDGDVANFLVSRFNFNSEQFKVIAHFLAEAADMSQDRMVVGGKV